MKRNGLNIRLCVLYLHYILKSVLDDYLHPLNGGIYSGFPKFEMCFWRYGGLSAHQVGIDLPLS